MSADKSRKQFLRTQVLRRHGIEVDAPLATQSHSRELAKCAKLVRLAGGTCNVFAQAQRLQGSPGMPDAYCQFPQDEIECDSLRAYYLAHGRERVYAFWLEVKVGADQVSLDQRDFIERERRCERMVIVGDRDTLLAFLTRNHIGLL